MTRRLILGVVLLAACATDTPTGPADALLAKGGNSGGGDAGVPVTQLTGGNIRCSSSSASALNSEAATIVVGSCTVGGQSRPFSWTAAGGMVLLSSDAGSADDVSDANSIFGSLGARAYARSSDGTVTLLPMEEQYQRSSVRTVAADGSSAFGWVEQTDETSSTLFGARWYLNGGQWMFEPAPGASAANGDGSIVASASFLRAAVWTRVNGDWVRTGLPDAGASRSEATGINAPGTVVVGAIRLPLPRDPALEYSQPVAWVSDGVGGWDLHLLPGINVPEGRASAVADLTDGSTVVVGRAYEDKSGKNSHQLWAVAWRRANGATTFSSPIRLQPLVKGVTAVANDVNSKGEIVGDAFTRTSAFAVMWRLP